MPFMYILECSDGSYYVGSTWNIEKRISEHKSGERERQFHGGS
jgi:putative endonuclease